MLKIYQLYSDASNKDNEVAARRSWRKQASKQASKQTNKQTEINKHT
jgi:hypothetical protein